MSIWERDYTRAETAAPATSFAQRVYGWMTAGLLLTAAVAYTVVRTHLSITLLPYWWIAAFGTLGIALYINAALQRLQVSTMIALLAVYSGLQGVFFGTMLPQYAHAFGGDIIWVAFLTAGVVYGLAMGYGLFAKTDLTKFSKIFQIGITALIVITLLFAVTSIFTPLPGAYLLISYVGLILFVAMTAFDAQQIRRISYQVADNTVAAQKLSLMMALKMYLNVIMIFWYILQILSAGRRR